jgi:hypothetical protein
MEEDRRKRFDLVWASVFATAVSVASFYFHVAHNVGNYWGAFLLVVATAVGLWNVTKLLVGDGTADGGRVLVWVQVSIVLIGLAWSALADATSRMF